MKIAIGPMAHFHFLWRWAYGRFTERREMAYERHVLIPMGNVKETVAWLEWRGYRCAVVTPMTVDTAMGSEYVGKAGVLFSKKNEPAVLAQVGDVLEYDGDAIWIEE